MSLLCANYFLTRNLPNIWLIICKPEHLNIKFKTLCYACTEIMIWIKIQRNKAKMTKQQYYVLKLRASFGWLSELKIAAR